MTTTELLEGNEAFYEKARRCLSVLFQRVKRQNELHYALSLNPEFRGMQSDGWSTTDEAKVAFQEYNSFLQEEELSSLKVRIALAFYSHISEASGFYEIPKNMLRVDDGLKYSVCPFSEILKIHSTTGEIIAPNADKVLRNLSGHSQTMKQHELAEVFRDAFDGDVRNGYAHADYII